MSVGDSKELFDDVISRAIPEIRAAAVDPFTFAFYHDHESAAVSICVDTESNSARSVRRRNRFMLKHFADAIAEGNLKRASLLKANLGRSISLGDFAIKNLARTKLGSISTDGDFYLDMIRTLRGWEPEIIAMASDSRCLLFCTSSAEWEVGYIWSAPLAPE